jgi:hypothetical protein
VFLEQLLREVGTCVKLELQLGFLNIFGPTQVAVNLGMGLINFCSYLAVWLEIGAAKS